MCETVFVVDVNLKYQRSFSNISFEKLVLCIHTILFGEKIRIKQTNKKEQRHQNIKFETELDAIAK